MEAPSSEVLDVDSGILEVLYESIKQARWAKSKLRGLSTIQEGTVGFDEARTSLATALLAKGLVLLPTCSERYDR
jgi:hypothetical protein